MAIFTALAVVGAAASAYSAKKQGDAAKAGAAGAEASSKANLDFQQEQWETQMEEVEQVERMFGPVKENMSNYYQNMSAEQYELRGKEQLEKQYKRSDDNLDALFSNNGMYNSGQRVSAQVALEAARESNMAQNKLKSESDYNQQQMNWLNFGLQEENQARGEAAQSQQAIGQAYGTLGNTQMQGGQAVGNAYAQDAQGWGQFGSGMLQVAGYQSQGGFKDKSTLGGS